VIRFGPARGAPLESRAVESFGPLRLKGSGVGQLNKSHVFVHPSNELWMLGSDMIITGTLLLALDTSSRIWVLRRINGLDGQRIDWEFASYPTLVGFGVR
jgi:hypothetical protein